MIATPNDLLDQTRRDRSRAPYFGLGFRKTSLPSAIFQTISDHFSQHKDGCVVEPDIPFLQNHKPNYSPSLMVHGSSFNRNLGIALKPLHEEWSGMELEESSCYGIRVYQPGSILYNHVDRTKTHIISSTICVGHKLNAPWPLYIEDIDGNPHQISMEPGEMVFYEGAKLLHGRPYPLDGRFYAGIFVHYIPTHLKNEMRTM